MNMRQQIVRTADCYAEASGIGRKRISFIVLKRGMRLDEIAEGRDLNTGTFEAAMQWFSDNWPADAAWPAEVARPVPAAALEAAE